MNAGGANDWIAGITSGTLVTTRAYPSTPNTGTITVQDCANTPPTYTCGGVPSFAFQINSNIWPLSPICGGADNPTACRAWQQFVYRSEGPPLLPNQKRGRLYMQYWLFHYNNGTGRCPTGSTWSADPLDSTSCVRNGPPGTPIPDHGVDYMLRNSDMSARITGSPAMDVATLTIAGTAYAYSDYDSSGLYLASGWNQSQFNVVGHGSSSMAQFSAGTTINITMVVNNNTSNVPTCIMGGTTGEINNLNRNSCAAYNFPTTEIMWSESN